MTQADIILRIATRVAALGSERDAQRLREVVVWIVSWEVKVREFEAVEARLRQCEGERDHIRHLEFCLRPRLTRNQDPKERKLK